MSPTRRWASPSFLFAIMALLGLGGGYVWYASQRDGRTASEMIVREFAKKAAAEVGKYRRSLREAMDDVKPGTTSLPQLTEKIHEVTAAALEQLEARADECLVKLDDIQGLALQTSRNRHARIRERLREAKEAIAELRADTEAELRGDNSRPTSEKR